MDLSSTSAKKPLIVTGPTNPLLSLHIVSVSSRRHLPVLRVGLCVCMYVWMYVWRVFVYLGPYRLLLLALLLCTLRHGVLGRCFCFFSPSRSKLRLCFQGREGEGRGGEGVLRRLHTAKIGSEVCVLFFVMGVCAEKGKGRSARSVRAPAGMVGVWG